MSHASLTKHLSARIERLLERYPLLSCYVVDSLTPRPSFAQKKHITVEDVLHSVKGETISASSLFTERFNTPTNLKVHQAPLWKVEIVEDTSRGDLFVVLTAHHVIMDGKGASNTFQVLLSDAGIQEEDIMYIPPPSEDVVDLAPSISYIVPKIFFTLLLPKLPTFLQHYLAPTPPWLCGRTPESPPRSAHKRTEVVELLGATSILRRLALSHRVPTINSVLHTACAATCFALAGPKAIQLSLYAATAISERIPEKCTSCTGNFVSTLDWHGKVTASTLFWQLARKYAGEITSPTLRARARHNVGALAYLPDAPSWQPVADRPTQWEDFLLTRCEATNPFDHTFAMSNLGRISAPHWVRQLTWAQRPPDFGAPLVIDACGQGDNIMLSVGCNIGILGPEIETFAGALNKTLNRILILLEGQDVTLADLAQQQAV